MWEDWGKDKWCVAGSFCLIFPTAAVGSVSSLLGGYQGITVLGVGQKGWGQPFQFGSSCWGRAGKIPTLS